jgi:hypothetical protein
VVYGYDELGYYYSGPGVDDGKGPKSWKELGDTGIGIVELYNLKPVEPKTPQEVVRSAFEKALKHAENPKEWIFENYGAGLKGFDNWISGLESGIASRFGMGYNAAVWHECRKYAVDFLGEAREHLGGLVPDLFNRVISHYQLVADRLGELSEVYPFNPEGGPQIIPVDGQCLEAVRWLKEARKAEAEGLMVLEQIVKAI